MKFVDIVPYAFSRLSANENTRHFSLLLQRLAAAEVEADIPGVADTRLAGWRTGKAADMSEEQHGTSDVVGAGADLEPVCGDVVEVRSCRGCFLL